MALTVSAVALVGGFLSVNQSIRNTRQSQERSEAVKIAQQQIEQTRTLQGELPPDYCLNSGQVISWNPTSPKPPTDHNQDELNNYPEQCKPSADNSLYYIWINSQERSEGTSLLTVRVRWHKLGTASGTNQVELLATKNVPTN